MTFEEGPFIQVACFCDTVLEDKTGAISLIRIIDTITHPERGPSPPEKMPSVLFPLKLVLMFKSGMAKGRSTLKIVPEEPDGTTENPIILTLHFDGDEKGQNVILNLNYKFENEGLYWFDVYIEDNKMTSIPIRVKYERMIIGTAPQ